MKISFTYRLDKTARVLAFVAHLAASLTVLLPLTAGGTLALVRLCREIFCDTTVDQRNLIRFMFDTPSVAPIAALFFTFALFVLMRFAFNLLRSWIFPKDATLVPSGRVSSALKGGGIGLAAFLLLQLFVCPVFLPNAFLLASRYGLLILAGCVAAGALVGARHPLAREPKRRAWILSALLTFLPIYAPVFVASLVLSSSHALIKKDMHYSSRVLCDLALGTRTINKMLPKGATNISVDSRQYIIFRGMDWTCSVSEADFLAFAKENGYELAENDSGFNANPETNHERVECYTLLELPKCKLPESYYFYNYCYRNFGGWTILYDRTKHILYGHYSSN